jgi:hypothetical protein
MLTLLDLLALDENKLTGDIPTELGLLTLLQLLDLSKNQLTGGIPSEIGMLHQYGAIWIFPRTNCQAQFPLKLQASIPHFGWKSLHSTATI